MDTRTQTRSGTRGAAPSRRRAVVRGVVATLGAAAAAAMPTVSVAQLFVPNSNASSVTVHPVDSAGDAPPMRTIAGAATGLSIPFALVVDGEHREVFVASFGANSVVVFELDDNGNVAPERTIAGPATQMQSPIGLALDLVHDELVVRNFGGTRVQVFARDADGDAAPLRTLEGPATGLDGNATDVAVDPVHDELFVTSRVNSPPEDASIRVFARTAAGNTAPIRVVTGSNTGLEQVYGIALDAVHDEIVVSALSAVRVFARTASGNVAPLRSIAGPSTQFVNPTGVAVDLERDEIAVADQNGRLYAFARTANGDVAPLRVVQGPQTGLNGSTLLDLLPQIFADGFQSGDATAWSAAVP